MARLIVCPHCERPGVTMWAVRWSGPALPATCRHCQGLSHVLSGHGVDAFTGTLAFVSLVWLLMGQSPLGGVSGIVLAVALNLWGWRRVELFPTFADRAKISRRAGGAAGLLAWLSLLF